MSPGAGMPPCAACGLPAPSGERYCCYGCELADSIRAEARADHGHLYGTLCFVAILSMAVMMLSLFLYAEDVFDVSGDVEMAWMRTLYRWTSGVLATPVMLLAGWPLLVRAAARWRSMDALIALGAMAAYALSCAALWRGEPAVYFETATTAVVLATFGRYLEATARSRASRSLGPLVEVAREPARIREAGGLREIPAAAIEPGMFLEVGPDQVVPADLELACETAVVDLAVLTGESRPVTLVRGDTVPAGAVAAGQALSGRALRAARDSALERLGQLARGLSERPSRGLYWADAFASWLAPVACVVALGALAAGWHAGSLASGISRALAVLLAACPCAYAIASPLVYWLALRAGLSHRVLIRSADVLEALARVRTVAFDKTGTLTGSRSTVTHVELAPGADEAHVRALTAALEAECDHPAGRALADWASSAPGAIGRSMSDPGQLSPEPHGSSLGAAAFALADRRLVPGRGVEAVDGAGRAVAIGLGAGGDPELSVDGVWLARFALAEEIRPDARVAVRELAAQGLAVLVLSGDDRARVEAVGRTLGVPVHARLSPEAKVRELARLGAGTAMVGDGVNDAPALAGRLTGFSPGGAAPMARGVAQVTLLAPDLTLVPWTLAHARHALSVVRRLLVAATLYNLVFVALAAAGLLKPAWAGLSMLTSSLLSLAFASSVGGVDAPDEGPERTLAPGHAADAARPAERAC